MSHQHIFWGGTIAFILWGLIIWWLIKVLHSKMLLASRKPVMFLPYKFMLVPLKYQRITEPGYVPTDEENSAALHFQEIDTTLASRRREAQELIAYFLKHDCAFEAVFIMHDGHTSTVLVRKGYTAMVYDGPKKAVPPKVMRAKEEIEAIIAQRVVRSSGAIRLTTQISNA